MNYSKLRFIGGVLVIFLFLFAVPATVFSQIDQDISINDLSKIKVDELTDEQVKLFIEKASESGMTYSQLEAAAMARGMPYSEIVKLRGRISQLENEELPGPAEKKNTLRELNTEDIFKRKDFFRETLSPEDTLRNHAPVEEDGELKVFGSSIFTKENLTFEPSFNIPTPKNYILGAGDEVLIEIYGASQESYALTINPEGWVKINNLAPVRLSGLSIEEATKVLKQRLSGIYSGMRGSNPNTFAEISLGDLRSISVNIAGEVKMPGTYTLPSLSTVFNALYMAGGPNESGSFRKIQVIRNNEVAARIDLYDFLLTGIAGSNIRLQDEDIVFVDAYVSRVFVDGEVKRPAIYEVVENEDMEDVIRFAGGFSENAYTDRIKVTRNTERQKKILDISGEDLAFTPVKNGDDIRVEKILPRFENRVTVKGAVYRAGEYGLREGMTLQDLIQKAEGLREDAYLNQASLYRLQDNLKTKIIPVNLSDVLAGTENISLQREDVLFVSSIFDLEEIYTVKINGEVLNPGEYPFYDNMNLGELVRLSGGLKESASLARLEVARRIRDNKAEAPKYKMAEVFSLNLNEDFILSDSAVSFELKPFDIVFIRRSPGYEVQQLASIEGEIAFPGKYSIVSKDERISDLIERAGGLTDDAYAKGATLYRKTKVEVEKARMKALEQLEQGSTDSLFLNQRQEMKEQAIGINLPKILAKPGSDYDLLLQDGDRLRIPLELQTVRLSGAVLYPVTVSFDDHKTVRHYINNAGGFAENAQKKKTYVLYPNGSVDRTRSFLGMRNYPDVQPGSEIIVPHKPERERVSAQQAISFSSAVASFALVVVTIIGRL